MEPKAQANPKPRSPKPRSRLIWWLVPTVVPACVLAYRMPGFWANARDAAEKVGEPKPVKAAVLYVVAWFAAAVVLPLVVALVRRRKDSFLAVLDETLTMALVAIAISGGIALVVAG